MCCDVWRRTVYIYIISQCTQVGSLNKLRVRVKGGGDRLVSIQTYSVSLRHRSLVSSLYSPSQNVSCFNLVQTPPWWIACSINLDCFFKLFPSSPSPCVNKLSNPLISAGTRYHLTSLYHFRHRPFFFFCSLLHTPSNSPRQVFKPSPRWNSLTSSPSLLTIRNRRRRRWSRSRTLRSLFACWTI